MQSVYEWCNGRKIWTKPSFQIKSNQDLEIEGKTMKENIKNLHVQRTMWKSHGKNSLCWVFVCEW
jgi:hypothetical protein